MNNENYARAQGYEIRLLVDVDEKYLILLTSGQSIQPITSSFNFDPKQLSLRSLFQRLLPLREIYH